MGPPPESVRIPVDFDMVFAELTRIVQARRKKIGGVTYVPCNYVIRLAPKDMAEQLEGGLQEKFQSGLHKELFQYLNRNDLKHSGILIVRLVEDEKVPEGSVGFIATYDAADSKKPGPDERLKSGPDEPPKPGPGYRPEPAPGPEPPHSGPPALASIYVLDGPNKGQSFPIRSLPATIGVAGSLVRPEIALDNAAGNEGIAARHAVVDKTDAGFTLTAAEGTAGTTVDGAMLDPGAPVPLKHNAQIVLARKVRLAFRINAT